MKKQAVLFLPRVCVCVYTCMYAILVEQGRMEQRREILPSPRLAQAAVEAETNISEHLLCAQGTTNPSPSQPWDTAVLIWVPAPLLPGRKWRL